MAKRSTVRPFAVKKGSAKPRASKPRAEKALKDQVIPGLEGARHVELDAICGKLADLREQDSAIKEERKAIRKDGRATMHRLGVKNYAGSGIKLALVPGEETLEITTYKQPE